MTAAYFLGGPRDQNQGGLAAAQERLRALHVQMRQHHDQQLQQMRDRYRDQQIHQMRDHNGAPVANLAVAQPVPHIDPRPGPALMNFADFGNPNGFEHIFQNPYAPNLPAQAQGPGNAQNHAAAPLPLDPTLVPPMFAAPEMGAHFDERRPPPRDANAQQHGMHRPRHFFHRFGAGQQHNNVERARQPVAAVRPQPVIPHAAPIRAPDRAARAGVLAQSGANRLGRAAQNNRPGTGGDAAQNIRSRRRQRLLN